MLSRQTRIHRGCDRAHCHPRSGIEAGHQSQEKTREHPAMKKRMTPIIRKSGGWYIAYIREIPGVNTQGRTLADAHRNLKEALALIVTVNRELESKRH